MKDQWDHVEVVLLLWRMLSARISSFAGSPMRKPAGLDAEFAEVAEAGEALIEGFAGMEAGEEGGVGGFEAQGEAVRPASRTGHRFVGAAADGG